MQWYAPPAAILAQMLSQLVARFLRFMVGSCWALCWAFCRGQPCRSAAKSYRRTGASCRRCPVFIRPFPEETPTCRLLDRMLDLWLRGSMKAVAGRAFVLVQWFRIALPRAVWKASRSMDCEPNQEHWAARTTPAGSRCFASSSSRWWRYHGHPSVPWRQTHHLAAKTQCTRSTLKNAP